MAVHRFLAHRVVLPLVVAAAAASPVSASDAPLRLDADEPVRGLAAHVRVLEDAAGTLTPEAARRARFEVLQTPRIDFGFTDATLWLRLDLRNGTAGELARYLSFNTRFMQDFDVWRLRGDRLEHVLANDRLTPFAARPEPYRHLLLPFTLAPHEDTTFLVRYWSEGTTALPLSIETPVSLAKLQGLHSTKNGAFYTFMAFLLLFSLLLAAMLRQPVILAYAFYLGTVAAYVGHMDGYTFQYLWPAAPAWNADSALFFGMLLNVGAASFSMAFLDTRSRHRRMHILLLAMVVFSALYVASAAFLDRATLKQLAFPITGLFSLCLLACGLRAWATGQRDARFYVFGLTGLVAAAVTTTLAHWSEGLMAVGMSFELIRAGILFDATMMGLAVADQYNGVRRARDSARQAAHRALSEKLALQARFLRLEARHQEALRVAEARGLQLAGASHDLRQPLAALRLALGHGVDADDTQRRRVDAAISYLDDIVSRALDGFAQDATSGAAAADSATTPSAATELRAAGATVAVPDTALMPLFENLRLMFEEDARGRGLALRIAPTSLRVEADPLALMRALANLVANAVKYTRSGAVLIGCRRSGANVRIQVHDTGPGLAPEAAAELTEPLERGDTHGEAGHGLGLAVTKTLAREQGMALTFAVRGNRADGTGGGTCATLTVPAAASSAVKMRQVS